MSTRDRILHHLKTRGPRTASWLAGRLGLTPMAVRQHLYQLAEAGLVLAEDVRQKVGRPARHWRLAEPQAAPFPDAHAELSASILEAAREALGEEGLARIVAERTRRQLADYRRRLGRARGLAARIRKLTALRTEDGYMAESRKSADGSFLLVENHCPICVAARCCVGLCHGELELFREVLEGAEVERTEHIAAGARRCAYRIRRRGKAPS